MQPIFKNRYLLIACSLIFFTSCKKYYLINNAKHIVSKHQKIAILPPKVVFTGIKPEKITWDQIHLIEEKESEYFQRIFFNEFASEMSKRSNIKIQQIDITLKLLADSGISILKSWDLDPQMLAKKLSVDAVFTSTIYKEYFIDDMSKMGIQLSDIIGGAYSEKIWAPVMSSKATKNNDIIITANLVNTEDGVVLYSREKNFSIDWETPYKQRVKKGYRKISKNAPYKKWYYVY